MKYKICEWEDNGYHDSYFYGVYYDTDTGLMHEICTGATAYAGGIHFGEPDYTLPPLDIIEKCRVLLAAHIYTVIRDGEHRDVLTPNDAKEGDSLRLIVPHSGQVAIEEPCHKCEGTGFWVNKYRPTDKRQCFACHGRGKMRGPEKARTADGKIARFTLPAETVVTVQAVTAFGKFYRNGYNKPNRNNRSVLALAGGELLRIPLIKLRLDREPMPDTELRERAESLSHEHQYGAMFGCKAWLSANWVQVALGKHRAVANRSFEKVAA